MPRYMILAKYSQQGMASTTEEGFASREHALRPAVEALGGQLEALYFCPAFSGQDFVLILTAPDNEVVNALTFSSSANPAFAEGSRMIELKTGSETDATIAAARSAIEKYRSPGA